MTGYPFASSAEVCRGASRRGQSCRELLLFDFAEQFEYAVADAVLLERSRVITNYAEAELSQHVFQPPGLQVEVVEPRRVFDQRAQGCHGFLHLIPGDELADVVETRLRFHVFLRQM